MSLFQAGLIGLDEGGQGGLVIQQRRPDDIGWR